MAEKNIFITVNTEDDAEKFAEEVKRFSYINNNRQIVVIIALQGQRVYKIITYTRDARDVVQMTREQVIRKIYSDRRAVNLEVNYRKNILCTITMKEGVQ